MNKNNFIIIGILISGFIIGYFTMFFLDKSNIDYSANHIETYTDSTVKYEPENNTITVITKEGKEIIYTLD